MLSEIENSSPFYDTLHSNRKFTENLTEISRKLSKLKSSNESEENFEDLRKQLTVEIENINFNLPGRLWLPGKYNHHIVRIPPCEAMILNSRERAPFSISVEVLDCDDKLFSPLPHREVEYRNSNTEVLKSYEEPSKPLENSFINEFQPFYIRKSLEQYQHEQNRSIDNSSQSSSSSSSVEYSDIKIESYEVKKQRIRTQSPYGKHRNWKLCNVIIKSNDNLVREQFAMMLISELKSIFDDCGLDIFLMPYRIYPISFDWKNFKIVY